MESNEVIFEKIQSFIDQNKVFLFMKGTPDQPQCGFSAQVVAILREYTDSFNSANVLEDWDLREGIKEFSSWPTIPQLYIDGKFIGGCDIIMELHRKGEFAEVLSSVETNC